jgi:hypothetical protein
MNFARKLNKLRVPLRFVLDEMLDALLDVFDWGNAVPRCVKSRYGKRRMRARAHSVVRRVAVV